MNIIGDKFFLKKSYFVISVFLLTFFVFSLIKLGSFKFEGLIGFTLFDDAMISMRYAYNFLEKGIIEWSHSSGNVEGLTNIGWMFVMSLAIYLSNIYIAPLFVSTISFIFFFAGFLILIFNNPSYRELKDIYKLSALVGSISILFWSVRGFEVSILFLIYSVLFSYISFLKQNRSNTFIATLSIFVGTFIRDDFGIIIIIFIFLKILSKIISSRKNFFIDRNIILILSVVIISLLFKTYCRYEYFKEVLPNTYYLKVYGHEKSLIFLRGLISNLRNIFSGMLLVPLFVVSSLFIYSQKIWLKTFQIYYVNGALELISAFFIYNLLTGGDAWEWSGLLNRFLCIAEPFIILDVYCFILKFFQIQNNKKLNYKNFEYKKLIRLVSYLSLIALIIAVLFLISEDILLISGMGNYKKTIVHFLIISMTVGSIFFINRIFYFKDFREFNCKLLTSILLGYYLITPSLTLLGQYSHSYFVLPELPHLKEDSMQAIKALDSNKYVPKNTTAVSVWAGTLPYYRPDLDFIDPLGKMDKYIARTKPRHSFFPGHTKWDWGYLLREYKPMYIFDNYKVNCRDTWLHNCTMEELDNYKQLVPGIMVRGRGNEISLDFENG